MARFALGLPATLLFFVVQGACAQETDPDLALCTHANTHLMDEARMSTVVDSDVMDDWRTDKKTTGCRITAAGLTRLSLQDKARTFYEDLRANGWERTPDPQDAPGEASLRFRKEEVDCLFSFYSDGLLGTDSELAVDDLQVPGSGELRYNFIVQCVPAAPSAPRPLSGQTIEVVIETSLGEIAIEVDSVHAPITAINFLRYVDAGLYEGGSFYRSVRLDNQPSDAIRIEVIQAGMNRERRSEGFPPIPLEGTQTTGLSHLDGTVSMARGGPDTARSAIFICIGPQPDLDEGAKRNPDGRGFAAFGQVIKGMDIVREIQSGTTEGQTLVQPVRIVGVRRQS